MTILSAILSLLHVTERASEPVDIAVTLDALAGAYEAQHGMLLDWRHSVVDLMRLLDIDSSLENRRELATELSYPGNIEATGAMNMWLHREIMRRVAENGGKVPEELL